MDKIYYWIGFIVTWAAAAFVVLCILFYLYCNDYFKFSIGKNSIFYKQWNLVWNPDFGKYTLKVVESRGYYDSEIFYSNEEFNAGDTIKISIKQ